MNRAGVPRRLALLSAAGLAVPRVLAQARQPGLTVGPRGAYGTLAAAVADARDGDTVLVEAGTYENDFAMLGQRISVRALGGMARLVATVPPPNGKAILVIGADAVLEGLGFSGARSVNLNGAGIRYEGGRLEILRCRFRNNEMNLLAASAPEGSIAITASEFGPTVETASLSHGLYVNMIGALTVRDSLFHGAITGHQIKSRALRTSITGSRVFDGQGFGSYSVDLPNGGECVVSGNVIEQGPHSRNPAIIHFGGEGEPHPASSLRIAGNIVLNRLSSPGARLLWNQTETRAIVAGNRVLGLSSNQIVTGAAEVWGTTMLNAAPTLDMSPPWRH